jgi:RHH-type rel operon transcriptional repressor/antitoxin RelB
MNMAIALKVSPELDKRLEELANKTHRSKSYYAREALERYIDDLEDYYLADAIRANPGRLYTLEEAEKILGLDD